MAAHSRPEPIDTITTIFLFIFAIIGLYQALQFPGRVGMWPTFVMAALLISVGVHLFNLFRKFRQTGRDELPENSRRSDG